MDSEKQGGGVNLTLLCFLLPVWIAASAAISSWDQGIAAPDIGWVMSFAILLSVPYSLSFLAKWKRFSFFYANAGIFLLFLCYLLFAPDIWNQLDCLWHHIRKRTEEVYGIPALPDVPGLREYSMEPAIVLIFFLIFWLTLYLFWRELPVLIQVAPMTCFYLFPIFLDASIEQGTMVAFFGGALLWWMVGRRKYWQRWIALVCGVPVFLLSICLVAFLFSEERYRSLLAGGDDLSGQGPAVSQETIETLFGQFAPEGYITYDNISVYELTIQSHLDRSVPFYLKNFEADTYRKGMWRGMEQRDLSAGLGDFAILKSGGLKVKKVAAAEDVVAYGENTSYRTDSLGRVFLTLGDREKIRRFQPMKEKYKEYLSHSIHKERIGKKDLPDSLQEQGKKLLGRRSRASYGELVRDIQKVFEESYRYTMAPGKAPRGQDEVAWFLKESHRGYCVHFASAAVFLFRSQGVQARYVQGYCLKPKILREKFPMQVKDFMAHAWVEIKIDDAFVPVDVTPASRWSAENSGAFGNLSPTTVPGDAGLPTPSSEPTVRMPEPTAVIEEETKPTVWPEKLFLFFLMIITAAAFFTAMVRYFRKRKPCRLYRRCLRRREWKKAIWLMQGAFLDFMADTGFVWEETDRERTREQLRYAASKLVYVEGERELQNFYAQLDRYVEMIFSLRYGKMEAERACFVFMAEFFRKIVNDRKKRESGMRRIYLNHSILARMLHRKVPM